MIYKTSDGLEIEVVVIRKKNKNLYFRVKEDLKLYVSAPMYLSAKSILNLINEELQELNTEMIDEISDSVNEKYMELYYLLMSENDVL